MDHTTNPTKNSNDEELDNPGLPRAGTARRSPDLAAFIGETAHHAAASVEQTADGVASFVGRKAEDTASYVGQKAEDAASYVGRKAEDAASYVGKKTDDASAAVGSGLRSLGHTVRDHGPEGGMAGDASSSVANTLERSGRYLQEEGLKDMAEDLTNLIRRNPISALLIGVAAGYLVGRAMTPRS